MSRKRGWDSLFAPHSSHQPEEHINLLTAVTRLRQLALLSLRFAQQDLRDARSRSILGPYWATLAISVQVSIVGLVFSLSFGVESGDYFLYVAVGLVLWNFLTTSVNEAAKKYAENSAALRQFDVPISFFVLRVLLKNIWQLVINFSIVAIILVFQPSQIAWDILWLPLGLVIFISNAGWIAGAAALAGARFQDIPPLVSTTLMVFFYLTPLIWRVDFLPSADLHFIAWANPVFHWIEVVRAPVLGTAPNLVSAAVASTTGLAGLGLTALMYRLLGWRVRYWV